MNAGLDWFFGFVSSFVQQCNFPIVSGVRFFDVMIVITLLAIVVRNFVHIAR